MTGTYGLYKVGKVAVRVRTGHDIYLAAVKQGLFKALCHTAHDTHDNAGALLLLFRKLLYTAVNPLLCIVADRAGVGQDDIGSRNVFRTVITVTGHDCKNHLCVAYVHLAAVSLYV